MTESGYFIYSLMCISEEGQAQGEILKSVDPLLYPLILCSSFPDTIDDIYELICAFPSLTPSSREGYEIPGEGYEIRKIWG